MCHAKNAADLRIIILHMLRIIFSLKTIKYQICTFCPQISYVCKCSRPEAHSSNETYIIFSINFQTGLMYWPFMQVNIFNRIFCHELSPTFGVMGTTLNLFQFLNFVLMPLYMRTAFMGCCAFLWATFLCFSRQSGDGTAAVALAFVLDPRKTLEDMREARLARERMLKGREK